MQITAEMTIGEIFSKFPEKKQELAQVLMNVGLGCIGCAAASFEPLKQGLISHSFSEEEIEKIIEDLNSVIDQAK